MLQAAKISGVEILSRWFTSFNPIGVSGVVIIAESHFSIHTWPEKGYAALDFYTCGNTEAPQQH